MGTKKLSAGILLYRLCGSECEVFLVHPGGPFWARKDEGAWSIPKGEYDAGADPLAAAKREFHEETGFEVDGTFLPLTPLTQPSGKVISAWAVEGDAGFFLRAWHTSELGAVNRVNQAIKVMYDKLGMDYALGLTLPAQLQRHGVMG